MASWLQKLVCALACCLFVQAAAEIQHDDRTITKVVNLLQEMLHKSKTDGTTEREVYAKYKCYCDDNEETKNSEISTLQTQTALLESQIEETLAASSVLSKKIEQLKKDIAANEKAMSDAVALRDTTRQAFEATEADLDSAVKTTKDAIDALAAVGADQTFRRADGTFSAAADHTQYMAGTEANFSLVSLASSLKQALVAASAFVSKRQAVAVDAFLQAPFTGTYTAQAGEVVGILKDMRNTFLTELSEARTEEKKAQTAFDKFKMNMVETHSVLTESHDAKNLLLSGNDASLASKRSELDTAQTDLTAAQGFLSSLLDMCSAKKKDYQDRVSMRTKEEAAIAEAIYILNSDAAYASFGTVSATKDGPVTLVQFSSIRKHVQSAQDPSRKRAQRFLERAASSHKSPLLTHILSLLQANNPFTVVLEEIDKMVALIAAEETADDEQKSWCDTERTDTQGSIDDKTNEITTLEGAIGLLQIDIEDPATGLKKTIADIEASLLEAHSSQVTETDARKKANVAYQADVASLAEVQHLLAKAVKVLQEYYARITQELQGGNFLQRKNDEPTPPATWEGDYAGQSVKSGSAIDMLKTILSNAKAEETQAHDDEMSAQHSYEDRMTQLKSEEATLQASLVTEKENLASKEKDLVEKSKNLAATRKETDALVAYLESIKPGCDFITTNLGTRKANRADETSALQNAKALLQDTPAYLEAMAVAHNESLGDCLAICAGAEGHVTCKACRASTSVPGYCAGHPTTDGC